MAQNYLYFKHVFPYNVDDYSRVDLKFKDSVAVGSGF